MGQFEGYTKFQDVVNNTNYTDQMNWSGYTTTVAGAGQAQKTPGSYGPFGVVGAPGETRTATAPSRSGGQETFTFTWNQDTKNWDQAALSNREMEQRKRLQFS